MMSSFVMEPLSVRMVATRGTARAMMDRRGVTVQGYAYGTLVAVMASTTVETGKMK